MDAQITQEILKEQERKTKLDKKFDELKKLIKFIAGRSLKEQLTALLERIYSLDKERDDSSIIEDLVEAIKEEITGAQ